MNSKLRDILNDLVDKTYGLHSVQIKEVPKAEKAIRQAVGEEMLELVDSPELMELLADIEHERWSSWQKWLYQNGAWNNDGSFTISPEKAQRWQKLTEASYAELDEPTKQYDRDEVTKNLTAIRQKIKQWAALKETTNSAIQEDEEKDAQS